MVSHLTFAQNPRDKLDISISQVRKILREIVTSLRSHS